MGQQLIEEIKRGDQVSDDLLVEIISKRTKYNDCIRNGYLLEDFPKTQKQALMLAEKGIIPDFVFYLDMHSEYCYSRVEGLSNTEFMYEDRVLSERLTRHLSENPGVMGYYEKNYGNVQYIDGLKSKWYVEDTIIEHIRNSIDSKSKFARNILDNTQACTLQHINVDRSLFNLCHSSYNYYCPVTWKHHQTFSNSKFMENTAVLYQPPNTNIRNLYFFRNLKERDIFINSPKEFSNPRLFPTDIPEWIEPHNAAQIISKEKNLANYCPVTLYEEDKVEKGYQLYLAFYKGNFFITNSL